MAGVGGMIVPIVIVVAFLLVVTLMRELVRMFLRRSLARTMERHRQTQIAYVAEGDLVPPFSSGGIPLPEGSGIFESGRWSMKWRDGATERITRLMIRCDPITGSIRGTGRDCIGDSRIEGHFRPYYDRVAWTQRYDLPRCTVILEVWGCVRRTGPEGRVLGSGQFCSWGRTSPGGPCRGVFTIRTVLVPTMIQQMLEMREMRPAPLPPVALLAMPDKVEVDQDTTCAVCLEECLLGAASGAGMLPCRHMFHEACIEQWLSAHNECPTCKNEVRPPAPAEARPLARRFRSSQPRVPPAARFLFEDRLARVQLSERNGAIETVGAIGFAAPARRSAGLAGLSPRSAAIADLQISLRNLELEMSGLSDRLPVIWGANEEEDDSDEHEEGNEEEEEHWERDEDEEGLEGRDAHEPAFQALLRLFLRDSARGGSPLSGRSFQGGAADVTTVEGRDYFVDGRLFVDLEAGPSERGALARSV